MGVRRAQAMRIPSGSVAGVLVAAVLNPCHAEQAGTTEGSPGAVDASLLLSRTPAISRMST